jgi:glutamyl-tRNA reductase
VEVREKLAFNDNLDGTLRRLLETTGIKEGVLLSTCNRVEVIACATDPQTAAGKIKEFLAVEREVPRSFFEEHLYTHTDKAAVGHLFRVAASLDSMVVGEPQILGQIKDSYAISSATGTVGTVLHRGFHKSFAVAKRVRTETRVAAKAVSVSSAAVELARKIFDRLADKTAMLIGAGEMSELAARHLQGHGIGTIIITNRTFPHATELAHELGGTAVPFESFPKYLKLADVVIGSAGGSGYLLGPTAVLEALRERKRRPMFFIDLGVPRNFDPRLNDIDNVFLYDIDDLERVIEDNKEEREKEALKAEAIVEEEVESFCKWLDTLGATPTIVALRKKAETIRRQELEKTLSSLKDLPPQARGAMEALTTAIINKLLHAPTTYLKRHEGNNPNPLSVEAIRRLFDLDGK